MNRQTFKLEIVMIFWLMPTGAHKTSSIEWIFRLPLSLLLIIFCILYIIFMHVMSSGGL